MTREQLTGVLADLDFNPECCIDGCAGPATHIVRLLCGCTYILCADHTSRAQRAVARNGYSARATCRGCGHVFLKITRRQLYVSIEPL